MESGGIAGAMRIEERAGKDGGATKLAGDVL